jgi:hypothetical protein
MVEGLGSTRTGECGALSAGFLQDFGFRARMIITLRAPRVELIDESITELFVDSFSLLRAV